MLDWTGERFVPWAKEAAVAYEHLHRYMWAATLVRGKRVLDLASGEGYGSNLLAGQAAYVCGVDIDEAAVNHATEKYSRPNLQFVPGSITDVPIRDNQSFDVIVCFEAIEHIEDHDALLNEVKRLLKPAGLFVVSTPNKDVGGEASNPFHVKELTFAEFDALLSKRFSTVRYLGQRLHPASSLWPLGISKETEVAEFVVERGEAEFSEIPNDKRVPRYFVGLGSDVPAMTPFGSVLLDHSDELTDLVNEKDRDLIATKASEGAAKNWFEAQLADRDEQLAERDEALTWRGTQLDDLKAQVDRLNKDLEWLQQYKRDLERTMTARDEALAWRAEQVDALEKALQYQAEQLQSTSQQLQSTYGELGLKKQELAEIYLSRGWKVVMKLRAVRDRLKGILGS